MPTEEEAKKAIDTLNAAKTHTGGDQVDMGNSGLDKPKLVQSIPMRDFYTAMYLTTDELGEKCTANTVIGNLGKSASLVGGRVSNTVYVLHKYNHQRECIDVYESKYMQSRLDPILEDIMRKANKGNTLWNKQ